MATTFFPFTAAGISTFPYGNEQPLMATPPATLFVCQVFASAATHWAT